MNNDTIRVVVCGDEGVGKSSLITSLVKDVFVPNIQATLPPITIPSEYSTSPDIPYTTVLVDASSLIQDRQQLQKEIRRATVIWLVYSDHYTCERISLFWLPFFRSMGVNLPIVLSANKCDLITRGGSGTVFSHSSGPSPSPSPSPGPSPGPGSNSYSMTEEMVPILKEFKEIESCIRCSAKLHYNVNQAFYLCQRAVTHPIAPLYDSKEGNLKPAAVNALERVFYLSDLDQDGYLNDDEFMNLQVKCFNKDLDQEHLVQIKTSLAELFPDVVDNRGISKQGFILLNKLYAEKGRHETTWGILRRFHYTDSLSLRDQFLYPRLDVGQNSSVELSPIGYRFLIDLFLLFDKDNDGGLSEMELDALFMPTPGIPKLWQETNFPYSTVRNEAGNVTLQGWLAQWSMTTYLDHKTTMAYLALLGFEEIKSDKPKKIVEALKVTRPRKARRLPKKKKRILEEAIISDETTVEGRSSGTSSSGNVDDDTSGSSGSRPGTGGSSSDRRNSKGNITTVESSKQNRSLLMSRPTAPVIVHRNVFNCFVLGASGSGKSSLLNSFLNRPFSESYAPTIKPVTAVNSVEVHGGKQCYLILEELGQLEPAVLENQSRLDECDVICYTYDSSDPDSFQYLASLRNNYPYLDALPAVYVALKADLDRQQQRCEQQPDVYTRNIGMAAPLHVSEKWPTSLNELFVQLAEAAQKPTTATPFAEFQDEQSILLPVAAVGAAISIVAITFSWIWRPKSLN